MNTSSDLSSMLFISNWSRSFLFLPSSGFGRRRRTSAATDRPRFCGRVLPMLMVGAARWQPRLFSRIRREELFERERRAGPDVRLWDIRYFAFF